MKIFQILFLFFLILNNSVKGMDRDYFQSDEFQQALKYWEKRIKDPSVSSDDVNNALAFSESYCNAPGIKESESKERLGKLYRAATWRKYMVSSSLLEKTFECNPTITQAPSIRPLENYNQNGQSRIFIDQSHGIFSQHNPSGIIFVDESEKQSNGKPTTIIRPLSIPHHSQQTYIFDNSFSEPLNPQGLGQPTTVMHTPEINNKEISPKLIFWLNFLNNNNYDFVCDKVIKFCTKKSSKTHDSETLKLITGLRDHAESKRSITKKSLIIDYTSEKKYLELMDESY